MIIYHHRYITGCVASITWYFMHKNCRWASPKGRHDLKKCGNTFLFHIFTCLVFYMNHDLRVPFQGINIVVDIWNEVGKGKVYLICRGGILGSHLFQSLAS